jgi:hypothetical protein
MRHILASLDKRSPTPQDWDQPTQLHVKFPPPEACTPWNFPTCEAL